MALVEFYDVNHDINVEQALIDGPLREVGDLTDEPLGCLVDFRRFILHYHQFQRAFVRRFGGKCLNIGCQHDHVGLGDLGAINLDYESEDARGIKYDKVKNFVRGDARKLQFEDETFDVCVLGEFLEHCTEDAAAEVVAEARRVLKQGGKLVMTIPLDGTFSDPISFPTGGEISPGITLFHQTWWSNRMLYELRTKTRMVERFRASIIYPFMRGNEHGLIAFVCGGWGLVWEKP